jgi:hypothetical protein
LFGRGVIHFLIESVKKKIYVAASESLSNPWERQLLLEWFHPLGNAGFCITEVQEASNAFIGRMSR